MIEPSMSKCAHFGPPKSTLVCRSKSVIEDVHSVAEIIRPGGQRSRHSRAQCVQKTVLGKKYWPRHVKAFSLIVWLGVLSSLPMNVTGL